RTASRSPRCSCWPRGRSCCSRSACGSSAGADHLTDPAPVSPGPGLRCPRTWRRGTTVGTVRKIAELAGRWFAVLVLLAGVAGLLAPAQLAPLAGHVPLFLGIVMFGMGHT